MARPRTTLLSSSGDCCYCNFVIISVALSPIVVTLLTLNVRIWLEPKLNIAAPAIKPGTCGGPRQFNSLLLSQAICWMVSIVGFTSLQFVEAAE